MRKILVFMLSVVLLLSVAGCGNEKARDISKSAYDSINTAYKITERFSSDLYEAWRLAIFDGTAVVTGGTEYLASYLNLNSDELKNGIAYISFSETGLDWTDASEAQKNQATRMADLIFYSQGGNLFSFCVNVVVSAYQANGQADQAENALMSAEAQIKELDEKYSDYDAYPALKGYYTTTSSFLDYCMNPTGNLEQSGVTINNYKNEVRDYISDLDYIFEE